MQERDDFFVAKRVVHCPSAWTEEMLTLFGLVSSSSASLKLLACETGL